ncbi:class I SAM-dependent methyltransferase [Paenibacillus sp. MMS20-IR301]|uniref:class I SAM-dependent methyltransferase n=1 Tax=Paenibacillus sp. MMS20-IR301 TaxID=2895946 RepID=UPI0028EADFB9|nr:class I SAM-dependent methyltransferase [Paenibacillus sp. MMS20-IR301]WNS44237.1 class I SAM-dependent methyltransferase [Paenibacillus sp. MMS20-IR301]
MSNGLFDPQVWETAWKEDPKAMSNKFKAMGMDPHHSFDHKAKVFNEEVFSSGGKARSERIISWMEGQGVDFAGLTVLDIGAASGGFTVPFIERGAKVTAVEPNVPLAELFRQNTAGAAPGQVELVSEAFEHIDIAAKGWLNAFDLVFVSMCPAVFDWESAEKVISCARQYCYISMSAGVQEHGLMNEVLPLLTGREVHAESSDMAYLLQLLYLKGYTYESIVTRETKSKELSIEAALNEVMEMLPLHHLNDTETTRKIITEYLHTTYPEQKVVVRQGGRFGKVLIKLQELNMYSRASAVSK